MDYKHARPTTSPGLSAGGGFGIGLALGLSVALAVYLHDRRLDARTNNDAPISTESSAGEHAGNSPSPAPESSQADTRFDFYDVLPKMEVEVADDKNASKQGSSANGRAGGAIDAPGSYVLQVGSYRNFADADRVRVRLSSLGVDANVQRVSIDNDTWHRVRIGPVTNLSKLEEIRRKLREAQIDALVSKQGK